MSINTFLETGYYDSKISNYFSKNEFSEKILISGKKIEDLRYGENPHQKGAIYSRDRISDINQLSGKKLSYNNYNDFFSALNISESLPKNKGTVIVKHGNPCGVSINSNKLKSFKLALSCDPISAFGGIVSCNFKIRKELALNLKQVFFEVIIGKGFDEDALKILKKKQNLRIIDSNKVIFNNEKEIKTKGNTFLVQTPDSKNFTSEQNIHC